MKITVFDVEDWERAGFERLAGEHDLTLLAEQKLSAAGLDVLPDEPVIREEAELLRSVYEERHDLHTLLANHVLVHMRNVVVTPHSAFNTREAVQRILDTTMENIQAIAKGEPIHVVT
jgi:D-lactate dehydrogenase